MILETPSRLLSEMLAARWGWSTQGSSVCCPGEGHLKISAPGPDVEARSLRVPSRFSLEAVAEIATWYVSEEEREYGRAQVDDLPQILDLYRPLAREAWKDFRSDKEIEVAIAEGEERITHLLEEEVLFLAKNGGQPWAICGLQDNGFVLASYSRGLRAGAFLALLLLSLAADSKMPEAFGIFAPGNETSKRLFARIGMSPTGREILSESPSLSREEWSIQLGDWTP